MIAYLIRALTGRTYTIGKGDISYLLAKGGMPFLRGLVWSLCRIRRWNGFLLGPHVQFVMARGLRMGRGVSIGGFSYIDCSQEHGVVLGDKVTIREHAWIQGRSGLNAPAHGLTVGAGSYIGPGAVLGIGGPVAIGAFVQIGAGLSIAAESHVADEAGSFVGGHVARIGVSIGDRCWLGNNVTVLDGVNIGADCIIGAGAVVTRSVPAGATAYGVPARVR